MTTAYTSLLGLALPVQGELTGAWGDTVNNSITSLLDTAVAGTTTLSTDADVTLTTTTGASNQARQAIINCTGARTALRTITAPAQSKTYVINNATTGGYSVKLVGVGPTTGVTIAAGYKALVAWNGSDFVVISSGNYDPAAVAITGGAINNATVGATTPSTGAFTTLSASTSATIGTDTGTIDTQTLTLRRGAASGGQYATLVANGAGLSISGSNGLTTVQGVGTFSSAGLAVTGALSATSGAGSPGSITSTGSAFQDANFYANHPNSGNMSTYYFQEAGSNTGYIRQFGSAYGSGLNGLIRIGQPSASLDFDTSGNLGLGVSTTSGYRVRIRGEGSTSATYALLVDNSSGTPLFRVTNDGAIYANNGAWQFDASGNLLVGTTSNGGNYKVVLSFAGASTNGLVLTNTSSTGAPTNLSLAEASQSLNNTDACAVYTDATTVRWNLRKNGGLANYSANNVNLSDARLKTDFQPAKSYFERWTDIDFITYLYKDQTDTERNLGVTAQQLESVFPELIDNSGFGKAPDGEAPYKAVYQTDFSYATAKALQEAIAKIKQLEADKATLLQVLASVDNRLSALEAK